MWGPCYIETTRFTVNQSESPDLNDAGWLEVWLRWEDYYDPAASSDIYNWAAVERPPTTPLPSTITIAPT